MQLKTKLTTMLDTCQSITRWCALRILSNLLKNVKKKEERFEFQTLPQTLDIKSCIGCTRKFCGSEVFLLS